MSLRTVRNERERVGSRFEVIARGEEKAESLNFDSSLLQRYSLAE